MSWVNSFHITNFENLMCKMRKNGFQNGRRFSANRDSQCTDLSSFAGAKVRISTDMAKYSILTITNLANQDKEKSRPRISESAILTHLLSFAKPCFTACFYRLK